MISFLEKKIFSDNQKAYANIRHMLFIYIDYVFILWILFSSSNDIKPIINPDMLNTISSISTLPHLKIY